MKYQEKELEQVKKENEELRRKLGPENPLEKFLADALKQKVI